MPDFKNPFDLYEQYVFAAKKLNLNIHTMNPEQKRQTMMFFYAGFGQSLLTGRDYVTELSEEEGVKKLQEMWDQVTKFWNDISKQS